MLEYTVWDRENNEYQETDKKEALAIIEEAELYTGPYGGLGCKIDQVLYSQDEDDEDNETIKTLAVHHDGEWLQIPEGQHAFISFELSQNDYEERTHGGKRAGSGRKPVQDPKIARSIKFSDTEWDTVKEKASAAGVSASEYVRNKVL